MGKTAEPRQLEPPAPLGGGEEGGLSSLSAIQAPRPPAPAAAPPMGPPVAPLRLHQAITIIGTLAQAVVIATQLRTAEVSSSRILMPAAILAITAGLAGTTLLAPAFYWAHRKLFMTAGRVALYSIPSFRQVGVRGAACAVLRRAALRCASRSALKQVQAGFCVVRRERPSPAPSTACDSLPLSLPLPPLLPRAQQVGAALMLEHAPQAGWRGAASDLARVTQGGIAHSTAARAEMDRGPQARAQGPHV